MTPDWGIPGQAFAGMTNVGVPMSVTDNDRPGTRHNEKWCCMNASDFGCIPASDQEARHRNSNLQFLIKSGVRGFWIHFLRDLRSTELPSRQFEAGASLASEHNQPFTLMIDKPPLQNYRLSL
jgi:hypothetical protein